MIIITELIDNYIARIDQAITVKGKQRIKDGLMLYYYRLSDQNKEVVRQQMQPFLAEIGQELVKTDHLVQQARHLLGIK